MLDWCQEVVPPGYWLSRQFTSLLFHESTAANSSSYDPLVVPGLLQTQDYASALFKRENLPSETHSFRVRVRLMRQQVLHSRGCEFVIHEQALRLPVGGNRVMNEQLLHLLLLSNEPKVTIRVVPIRLGERAYFGSGFAFFRYTGGGPLVYRDGLPAGMFVEDRDYVAGCHEMLVEMSDVALGRAKSREAIARLASEFDRPEAPPDDSDEQEPARVS